MIRLYIDFDGVILDTINESKVLFENKYHYSMDPWSKEKEPDIHDFYKNVDWDFLINNSPIINRSIENIKKLDDTGIFDISILTHVISISEIMAKRNFLIKNLPEIKTIYVERKYRKCDVVDPHNALLIDDDCNNLYYWKENGGESILFSQNIVLSEFIVIDNLMTVLELLNTDKLELKRKIKL